MLAAPFTIWFAVAGTQNTEASALLTLEREPGTRATAPGRRGRVVDRHIVVRDTAGVPTPPAHSTGVTKPSVSSVSTSSIDTRASR
jgi:hypothetical protein